MSKHKLKPIYNKAVSNESYTFSEGYQTMKSLITNYGLPDALICASDLMAMGASTLLQKTWVQGATRCIGYRIR